MNKEKHQDANDPFWDIVDSAVQTDVLLQVAANDSLVKDSVKLFVYFKSEDAPEKEDCKDALEGYIVKKYGVPPELSEEVFAIAGAMVYEEQRYGQA